MQLIAIMHLVLNHGPEKWGFWRIKRANPNDKIHPFKLGYHSNIQEGLPTLTFEVLDRRAQLL
jgi:hypothetical protein